MASRPLVTNINAAFLEFKAAVFEKKSQTSEN